MKEANEERIQTLERELEEARATIGRLSRQHAEDARIRRELRGRAERAEQEVLRANARVPPATVWMVRLGWWGRLRLLLGFPVAVLVRGADA